MEGERANDVNTILIDGGSSLLGALAPVGLMMAAICMRALDNDTGNMPTLQYVAASVFALYVLGEGLRAHSIESKLRARWGFGGIVGGLFTATAFFLSAENSRTAGITDDIRFFESADLPIGFNMTALNAIVAGQVPGRPPLFDPACADMHLSPSFADFGVSGTRTANIFFIIGLAVSAIFALSLEGTRAQSGGGRDPGTRTVSALLCLTMAVTAAVMVIILSTRIPERMENLGHVFTRGENIFTARSTLLWVLVVFLGAALAHDILNMTVYRRETDANPVAKRGDETNILSTIVRGLCVLATFVTIVGVSAFIFDNSDAAVAKRLDQIDSGGAGVLTVSAEFRAIPPAVQVCVANNFDHYQTYSGLLSTIVATSVLYTWRCLYATDYATPV